MGDYQEIINAIGPTDNLIWDISLYVLFFLNLIMLFLLPDGSTLHTMLIIIVLISIFIDKTYAFGYLVDSDRYDPETCHAKIFVGTYLIRAAMFVAPLMIAGSTEEGKVRAMGILLGVLSVVYMGGRWFIDQREVSTSNITCMVDVVAQTSGMFLTLAYATTRHSVLRVITVDRDVPGTVLR